ncbi:hypothetical protein BWD13_07295 [Leptospira santarosai serovar Grippotyphosa]|nr:hypothetical protein BWD13_07295 [Leptospira santarosai serovar Grippotyphosa]
MGAPYQELILSGPVKSKTRNGMNQNEPIRQSILYAAVSYTPMTLPTSDFFFRQKSSYEPLSGLVGSVMCIRVRIYYSSWGRHIRNSYFPDRYNR